MNVSLKLLANVEELNYEDDSYRIDLSFKATDLFLKNSLKLFLINGIGKG